MRHLNRITRGTGRQNKGEGDILEWKKCRKSQLDLEELRTSKEADLCIVLMIVRTYTCVGK